MRRALGMEHVRASERAPAGGNAQVSTDQLHGRAVGRPAPPLRLRRRWRCGYAAGAHAAAVFPTSRLEGDQGRDVHGVRRWCSNVARVWKPTFYALVSHTLVYFIFYFKFSHKCFLGSVTFCHFVGTKKQLFPNGCKRRFLQRPALGTARVWPVVRVPLDWAPIAVRPPAPCHPILFHTTSSRNSERGDAHPPSASLAAPTSRATTPRRSCRCPSSHVAQPTSQAGPPLPQPATVAAHPSRVATCELLPPCCNSAVGWFQHTGTAVAVVPVPTPTRRWPLAMARFPLQLR